MARWEQLGRERTSSGAGAGYRGDATRTEAHAHGGWVHDQNAGRGGPRREVERAAGARHSERGDNGLFDDMRRGTQGAERAVGPRVVAVYGRKGGGRAADRGGIDGRGVSPPESLGKDVTRHPRRREKSPHSLTPEIVYDAEVQRVNRGGHRGAWREEVRPSRDDSSSEDPPGRHVDAEDKNRAGARRREARRPNKPPVSAWREEEAPPRIQRKEEETRLRQPQPRATDHHVPAPRPAVVQEVLSSREMRHQQRMAEHR